MTKVSESMSKNVISISSSQTVKEAAELMEQHKIGAIPVVDNGVLKGMITDRDITTRSIAGEHQNNAPVSEIMTSDIISGNPNMSLEEASALMSKEQIRRLPIVENNHLVGIVALGDLALNEMSNDSAGAALSNISHHEDAQ
jgi:IMP dehydrogenase